MNLDEVNNFYEALGEEDKKKFRFLVQQSIDIGRSIEAANAYAKSMIQASTTQELGKDVSELRKDDYESRHYASK